VRVALLAAFAAIAIWNAAVYPPGLGYDAVDHIAYAEGIWERGELPDEEGEYYTPPLFYTLAGGAAELGEAVGLGEPYRLAQLLNALLAVATALLVLALARELWPGRELLQTAAFGFFCAGAVVLKAAAMVHPETLSLFLAALALVLAARMLNRGDWRVRTAVSVGVALGAGQLVRAWALWTFAVVVLALLAALTTTHARRPVVTSLAIVVAACAVVAGPWYGDQASRYSNPVFDRDQVPKPLWERRPASFYLDPGLPEVVTRPYRPSFVNRFGPTLYAEGWGDYFGVFSWRAAGNPDAGERRELTAQALAGLVPTALAIGGWLVLLARSVRRRDQPALLVSLLPLAGIAGLLYFTVSYPTPDGDVIKATYMLTTVPAWALCFGWAVDRVTARRALRIPLALLLAAAAAVSLRFGIHDTVLGGLL
jgi:hypothetical protein